MQIPPKVFRDVVSQPEAVTELLRSMEQAKENIHHAWLFTGPPGSGRSQIALAFAAALLCPDGGCGTCNSCEMVRVGNHPDVLVLNTERVQISVDEVTEFIEKSIHMPAIGKYRVMVVEVMGRDTGWIATHAGIAGGATAVLIPERPL